MASRCRRPAMSGATNTAMSISTKYRLARLVRRALPVIGLATILGCGFVALRMPSARVRVGIDIARRLSSEQRLTIALAVAALMVAMLQISREGSVAQWLYRQTIGAIAQRLIGWWRLAKCVPLTLLPANDEIWRRCKDVEVLVRPRGVPPGFGHTEIMTISSRYDPNACAVPRAQFERSVPFGLCHDRFDVSSTSRGIAPCARPVRNSESWIFRPCGRWRRWCYPAIGP